MVKPVKIKRVGKRGAALPSERKARLGQNFLIDPEAAQRIVAALGEIKHGTVIEIGPGRGAITQLLAREAGHLIAIELDRILAAKLRMAYISAENVEIIEGDVLNIDFGALAHGEQYGLEKWPRDGKARIVGNLPYYITSDILLRLFEFHANFDVIVIMVQREVADRLAAKPGTRDYGLLTTTTQLYAEIENLFTLPPEAFSPPPKVHSSVVRMRIAPKFAALGVEPAAFQRFLRLCFAQKRKTVLNNLKSRFDEKMIRKSLVELSIREDVRAEAMPLMQLAAMFRSVMERDRLITF